MKSLAFSSAHVKNGAARDFRKQRRFAAIYLNWLVSLLSRSATP